jgi:hypothetical protein
MIFQQSVKIFYEVLGVSATSSSCKLFASSSKNGAGPPSGASDARAENAPLGATDPGKDSIPKTLSGACGIPDSGSAEGSIRGRRDVGDSDDKPPGASASGTSRQSAVSVVRRLRDPEERLDLENAITEFCNRKHMVKSSKKKKNPS